MNSEAILRSDVSDILFENSNKDYRAYLLRKFYSDRLMKSLGFMLLVVNVLAAFTFLPQEKKLELTFIDTVMGKIFVPPSPEKKKEIRNKIIKQSGATQRKTDGTSLKINSGLVTDTKREIIPFKTGTLDFFTPGTGGTALIAPNGLEKAEPIKGDKKITEKDVTKPIYNPDTMPEYPGGKCAWKITREKPAESGGS